VSDGHTGKRPETGSSSVTDSQKAILHVTLRGYLLSGVLAFP